MRRQVLMTFRGHIIMNRMIRITRNWPIPEDDWTVVERPHGKPCGTNGCDRGRTRIPGRKLDISGLCCDELDEIIDMEALLTYQNEATRIVDTLPEIETGKETVIVKVKPIVGKQPDGIGAVSIDITDGRDNCPVNVVVTARGREHQNRGTKTHRHQDTPSVLMNEVLPQITEITSPMGIPISWKIEEDMEQSVESLCEVTIEVPTVRFDVGQLMQWPDMNSAGVMICEFTLESEMFSHCPTRREVEPVFVAAESEMFTPVFAGGGGGSLLSRTPWLWRRQLHREFLPCRGSEVISRPVCLRPLAGKTGGV